ncbi:hypothetical protein PXK56_18055 [Phaeobacter gallaeciensis]|uniref:DUF6651 domain-containing protein n=1 Tax=Phaeobacter gallaeciensis TaxID=60890 RepID=UPI002380C315|nr:DUF6651 domain-containing protein [Phaeobacter gallaeciensis]MDE4297094.1 hypothetical protein [Phaeobacter gallaeciensis]
MKKRFNPAFLRMGTSAIAWDAPGEGGTGGGAGDDDAAKAAAAKAAEDAKAGEEAAALKAAEDAEAKAKAEADAAAKAAEGGDADAKKLAEEKAELLREVMDKKNKLKDAQDDAADARAKLAEFGDVDPAKVKALLKAEQDAEQAALEAKGEFDRVKEMMATEHTKQLEAKDAEIEALKAAAASKDETIDKLTVGQSFSTSKFIQDDLILSSNKVRQLYGSHVGLQDGEVVVYDKPSSAKDRTVMVDGVGKPLSFDEGLKRLVDADPDKDTMIKSKMAPGGKSKTPAPAGKQKPKDNGLRGAARIAQSLSDAGEI